MASLNKVQIIGRIGSDLKLRTTQSGKSVLNFRMATSEYYKDQSGNRQENTQWHNIVSWNRQAEIIAQYCQKGSQIYIEGSLQTREWEKDGVKRYTTEIVVRQLQLLDSRKQDNQQQGGYSQPQSQQSQQRQQQQQPQQSQNNQQDEFVEDDIPF